MKIYTNDIPKNCDNCNIHKSYLGCCLTDFSRETPKTERHNKCPLQSLDAHDKQVRKKVCEEIRKKLLKLEPNCFNQPNLYDFNTQEIIEILEEI